MVLGIDDTARDYPYESRTINHDTLASIIEWEMYYLVNHWGKLHPYTSYNTTADTGVYEMATGNVVPPGTRYRRSRTRVQSESPQYGEVRIALAADWAAGTLESEVVAQQMVAGFDPHYTLHLGDVYMVGTPGQVKSNCLGQAPLGVKKGVTWPHGSLGSFALMGNHEMFSRGYGFFDTFLPTLGLRPAAGGALKGQAAPYFALVSDHWRVIGLDTGYTSYTPWSLSPVKDNHDNALRPEVVDWLNSTLRLWDPSDTRGVLLLSHHQYRSAFESQYLATPRQLAALLPAGREVLWLWGHEHRLAFYGLGNSSGIKLNAHARCVGNGGFPTPITAIPKAARTAGLMAFDDRTYTVESGLMNVPVGFNGFLQLVFTGPKLKIEYRSLAPNATLSPPVSRTTNTLLVTEEWGVAPSGDVTLVSMTYNEPNITRVTHTQ